MFPAPLMTIQHEWILVGKNYATLWNYSLGNYSKLIKELFYDEALRFSLDQDYDVECGVQPVENYAREWFERFVLINHSVFNAAFKTL